MSTAYQSVQDLQQLVLVSQFPQYLTGMVWAQYSLSDHKMLTYTVQCRVCRIQAVALVNAIAPVPS